MSEDIFVTEMEAISLTPEILGDVPDCFGEGWDASLPNCRVRCALRMNCKEATTAKLKASGNQAFRQSQIKAIESFNRREMEKQKPRYKILDSDLSPFVASVIHLFQQYRLTPKFTKDYIAIKRGARNLFAISKIKRESLDSLIKFIYTKEREQFPEDCLRWVSEERLDKYLYSTAENLDELKQFLDIYLPTI